MRSAPTAARFTVKQAQSVEIAYLMSGEVVSVGACLNAASGAAAALGVRLRLASAPAAALIVAAALPAAHRVVFGPAYLGRVGGRRPGCGGAGGRRAAARARGRTASAPPSTTMPSLPCRCALVRRTRNGYRLRLAPGSPAGSTAAERRCPSRACSTRASVDVPLAPDGRAELRLRRGDLRRSSAPDAGPAPRAAGRRRPPLRSPRAAAAGAGGAGQHLLRRPGRGADQRGRHAVRPFRPMPRPGRSKSCCGRRLRRRRARFTSASTSCRSPASDPATSGWASRCPATGEIRSHWIARSTYGADCPVEQCMSDVVSTWFFEPLPESMKVILPVQVLRTDKPLPYGHARARRDAQRRSGPSVDDPGRSASEND